MMPSVAWPICGSALLLAGTGVALWRHRPAADPRPHARRDAADRRDPEPADGQHWSLEALLDLVPHPTIALEQDGTLSHANQAARLQFGDTLAALLRHPLAAAAMGRAVRETETGIELVMDVPVRRVLRAALRFHPRAGAAGGLILLSLTDCTEQDAIDRMRADFIANASHELRTPLASLTGFIETLQGPAADDAPARIRFLAIMAEQAARMRRLIDNLLSLSRIQMHEHERPNGRVIASALLGRVAEEQAPQVAAAGARLTLEIAEDLPPLVADPDQLAQVLQNLLDNALKYGIRRGQAGRIVLSARAACAGRDPSPDGVVLSVADDGIGIAAKHIPRLTERFYRVEEGQAGRTGSGLGLAIVKHIVGRHGGRLTIESRPGQGAEFSVWLPRARTLPPEPVRG